ncbi:MAG TPA: biosynthetic peptidoglycan transglycosylase [Rectinemataceae bacterium]|nr:biosynthetic peptidoglycan transglycosylase [Rectinemataceae bacterium]
MNSTKLDSGRRQRAARVARGHKPFTLKRACVLVLKVVLIIHIAYISLTTVFIISYKFNNPAFTILMPYRSIGYGWKLQKPIPIALKKVPLYVRSMLVAVEDGKFYTHHGIDMEAFKRAKEINDRVGKPLYGGSTLTMQVARTLFLVPEKSYVRKYFEVITALELEFFLSKDRILELYFGYAEWGKGIFGIEAAARHWYGKGVASLTRDQAARLIALLSSPIKYTPTTLNKSGILRERYAYLTRRFVANQAASPDQFVKELPPPGAVEPGTDLVADGDVDGDAAQNAGMQPEIAIESGNVTVPSGTVSASPATESQDSLAAGLSVATTVAAADSASATTTIAP